MKISTLVLLFFFITFEAYTQNLSRSSDKVINGSEDTSKVIELNNIAFKNRLKDPDLTIEYANKALTLAQNINYTDGIGEAYRIKGIGRYYLNQKEDAIDNFLTALTYFKQSKNQAGEAKTYNNIGNLYINIDYDKSLQNFNKSLHLAQKLDIKDLIAGLYLNLGTVYFRKEKFQQALFNYQKSLQMFTQLDVTVGVTQSLQNLGVIYFNLNQLKKAENYLLAAKKKAIANDLSNSIASINLTLSSIYILQKKFENAEKTIKEGASFAKLVKSTKLEYDYLLTSYELENKRKNYQRALYYLQQVYKQDSITYKSNVSDKISLLEAQHRQLAKQRENELTIARQKYTQILFWASSIVTILAFIVIVLLVKNVRRSTLTNNELTRLNLAISKQKDDLDQANQNLEEIIDDRTKDLKIKNKKLSEYSSHLSHQIRSPVATLKGLLLLEKDDLIESEEFVEQMGKCIYDLDDKIMNINENLNNPHKSSLISDE